MLPIHMEPYSKCRVIMGTNLTWLMEQPNAGELDGSQQNLTANLVRLINFFLIYKYNL